MDLTRSRDMDSCEFQSLRGIFNQEKSTFRRDDKAFIIVLAAGNATQS